MWQWLIIHFLTHALHELGLIPTTKLSDDSLAAYYGPLYAFERDNHPQLQPQVASRLLRDALENWASVDARSLWMIRHQSDSQEPPASIIGYRDAIRDIVLGGASVVAVVDWTSLVPRIDPIDESVLDSIQTRIEGYLDSPTEQPDAFPDVNELCVAVLMLEQIRVQHLCRACNMLTRRFALS